MKHVFISLVCMLTIALAGCSSQAPDERLAALEAEVKALKEEATARDKSLREELARIRLNLEGIHSILEVEQGRAALKKAGPKVEAPEGEEPGASGEQLDEKIDEKAKNFVNENLDRLLGLTKKLIDMMETELDKRMTEMENEPEPQGDKI